MIGSVRLVNPWRGTVWGSFRDRIRVTTADGQRWEIHACAAGDDFYAGRSFSRHEISAWAQSDQLSPAELMVAEGLEETDLLGEAPAIKIDPQDWRWYSVSAAGESHLAREARPTAAEITDACAEALAADSLDSIPLIDRFELWGCDLKDGTPLALLLTGRTETEARGTFSPLWRFCRACDHTEATSRFQDAINARLVGGSGRFNFACRLFERVDQWNAIEIPLTRAGVGAGKVFLPRGLVAEELAAKHARIVRAAEESVG